MTSTSELGTSSEGSGSSLGDSDGQTADSGAASTTTGHGGPPTDDSTAEASETGEPSACGPDAECDDNKQAGCTGCTRDRLVFVTSEVVQGDLGGKPGIDDLCNQLADAAGLLTANQKRFRAWLSTSEQDAADRFYHSPGRYVLVNGEIFANSWDDIIAGDLQHPLNIDENGDEVLDIVWTDTAPDGRALSGSTHCDDWTSSEPGATAAYGYTTEVDGQWTRVDDGTSPTFCADIAALYCFEFN